MPTRPPGWASPSVTRRTKPLRFLLYKQRYIPHPDPAMQPYAVFGNTNDIEERIYDNMENVFVRDLLPVDERFDMNMHILSFAPAAAILSWKRTCRSTARTCTKGRACIC